MQMPLILASSSKYRKNLLAKLFQNVQSIAPNIDERSFSSKSPAELAQILGTEKAFFVSKQHPSPALIIGSDQVAVLSNQVLHKPGSPEANIQQLEQCSGKRVHFYTSVCVINSETGKTLTDVDETVVEFRHLTTEQITEYLIREPAHDCAGGFKVEGLGISLFHSIKTEDPNALVGLPLIKLISILQEFGISPLNKS